MDLYLVAAAVLAWVCVVVMVIAFFMGRDRMIDDTTRPQPVQPRYQPCTRDELQALFRNPLTPHAIRVMAAAELHRNGWCSCPEHPYDQDGVLTDTDLEWLQSQSGEAS